VRRVGREEAERLLTSGDDVVHEVTVVRRRPDLADPVRGGEAAADVHEVEYADGGVYAWSWRSPQVIHDGSRLWCTSATGEGVRCVRVETVLPEPEVLTVARGTFQVLRSRFATPQPTVLDTSVVAPADVTQGTGLTEDEALVVLRSHHARLVRVGRAWMGASCAALPVLGNTVNLLVALDNPVVVGVVAAVGLGPLAVASAAYLGPGRRRRGRISRSIEAGYVEPVEVVRWCEDTVTVAALDGRRWSWQVRREDDDPAALPVGTRVWATPLSEGGYVHLVGSPDAEGAGVPAVVEAAGVARTPRPPRAEIQDVVRS